MTPTPQSPVSGVSWHPRTASWRVRIQTGPYRGSYGYFDIQESAEQCARDAAAGLITPGTDQSTRYPGRRLSSHNTGRPRGPRKPTVTSVDRASTRSTTGVRGVSFNTAEGRYHVRIRVDGRYRSFGLHDTLDEAAAVARAVYAEQAVKAAEHLAEHAPQ
jgi:hypothetical protein